MTMWDGLPPGEILPPDDRDGDHVAGGTIVSPLRLQLAQRVEAEWAPWPRLPRRRVSHTNFMGRYLKKSCVDP